MACAAAVAASLARGGGPSRRQPTRQCCNVDAVVEWAAAEVRVFGVLIALLALLATLAYRWLVAHRRDFQILLKRIDKEAEKRERAIQATLERIDREAEKREQRIQAALERSDRAFETLTARANELTKELAGVA